MNSRILKQPAEPQLIVVEDDDDVRDRLVDAFALDGFHASPAEDIEAGRELLAHKSCDALVLDINLPDGSGYELLRDLRCGKLRCVDRSLVELPVVIVSGRSGEFDRIRGFDAGCDDYVVKPFSYGELRARVQAVLRRKRALPTEERIDLGELSIDMRRREVELGGRQIDLTDKEYLLLVSLAADPERVFERDLLLAEIWGYNAGSSTRTLDAHACRLRRKLSGGRRSYVHNSWGVGYRLCGPEVAA